MLTNAQKFFCNIGTLINKQANVFYLVFTKAPQIHLREAKDTNCQISTKYLQNTQLTVNKPQKVYTKNIWYF
jgi:hypothetical protein